MNGKEKYFRNALGSDKMLMQFLNQFESGQRENCALRAELKIDVPDLMSLPSLLTQVHGITLAEEIRDACFSSVTHTQNQINFTYFVVLRTKTKTKHKMPKSLVFLDTTSVNIFY